jgi:hypothetical protein
MNWFIEPIYMVSHDSPSIFVSRHLMSSRDSLLHRPQPLRNDLLTIPAHLPSMLDGISALKDLLDLLESQA